MDVTNYTAISDNIQYTDQENDYLIVVNDDATYAFELDYVTSGTSLGLVIIIPDRKKFDRDLF